MAALTFELKDARSPECFKKPVAGRFIHDRDKLRITLSADRFKSDKLLARGTIDVKYGDLLTVQYNVAQRIN